MTSEPFYILLMKFACRSTTMFPSMPECPGTQWISVAMLWGRRHRTLLLIRLTCSCPGPGSRCAVHRIVTCGSLMTATVVTPCCCKFSRISISTSRANPIPHNSGSKPSIGLVPGKLCRDLHSFLCLHTAVAPGRPSSECDQSVRHIPTLAPLLASFSLAQRCAALLAAVVSSMVVLTTGSSSGASWFVPWAVQACSCAMLTTLHIGAAELGFRCGVFSLPLHAFSSLVANRCCLECKMTGAGVSPHTIFAAPHGVVGSAPRMDLACQLTRSWRLPHLPTSLGSHQSSLPYCATAWTHANWMAVKLSGTTPEVLVRVQSLAPDALALFMHQLCCSLNVRCVCNQNPRQRVS